MSRTTRENWNDVSAIRAKSAALWDNEAKELTPEAKERYLQYYNEKCCTSKEMVTKAKDLIPGGVQHNLALNYPFPLAMDKAEGAYLWDVDGNRYIDFLQAGGPTILGSNPPKIREKVIELIQEKGPVTGLFSEYEYKLADLVRQYMPSIEMFRMAASGTEADMVAIRLARAYTGFKKVIKVGGAYHGWSDELVYDIRADGTRNSYAIGIPEECYANTQALSVNDLEGLETLMEKNKDNGGTACVLLEPIGPESGTRPVEIGYCQKVRELCDKYGALLIFDEVVTGFRVGLGGAQGFFGIKPDLTVFGKILTGGYPGAGAIGGRKDIVSLLAGGVGGKSTKVMVGGTLTANPLSCLAGYYTIQEIAATDACEKASLAADRLTDGLNSLIEAHGLPFLAYNQFSVVHLDTTGNINVKITRENMKSVMEKMPYRTKLFNEAGMGMAAEGIITIAASRLYTSLADTDDVIDDALNRFDRLFANYR